MAAFDAGFDKFHAEREAENIAKQQELENKRKQVAALFDILNSSSHLLNEKQLFPTVREGELLLVSDEKEFAKISPSAEGNLFEIKVGSKAQTFSGNAEGCIEELGKMVAKALFDRDEAERKSRSAARRRPASGGWMSN